MPKPQRSSSLVPAVSSAAAILRILGASPTPLGATAVARAAGLSPSSCFNILRVLSDENLASFDAKTKRYWLGSGLGDLARSMEARDPFPAAASPLMQELAGELDAAIGLWRLSALERVVLIHFAESASATRVHMSIGQRQPSGGGAIGRALMAARNPGKEALGAAFAALRWQAPLAFEDYCTQIEEARRRGYGLDLDVWVRGITSIATLIPTHGPPHYLLTASMFSRRHDGRELERIGGKLLRAAILTGDTFRRLGNK